MAVKIPEMMGKDPLLIKLQITSLKTMRMVPSMYNRTHGDKICGRLSNTLNAMFGGEEGAAEGDREETRPSLVCHPDVSYRELLKEKT
jgi:hypothetical protein